MFNYFFYDYKSSQIAKVSEDLIQYEKSSSIKSFLNSKCIENGSTLEGRKQAFTYLMNQKKFIPVVVSINPVEIYFPISSTNDPNCIWINYASIKNIKYNKKTCTLIFKDNTRLTSLYPERIQKIIHQIYRYLQRLC